METNHEINPDQFPRPDYDSERYAETRHALIANETLPKVTTEQEASQHLASLWDEELDTLRQAYEARAAERREREEQGVKPKFLLAYVTSHPPPFPLLTQQQFVEADLRLAEWAKSFNV